MMDTLAPSIFCDVTFDVTIFHYKIVLITTLDGNKQHRPLMCCFILRSKAAQWTTIFNIFAMHVMDGDPVFYVITSDQELAIRAGNNVGTSVIKSVCQ